MTAAIHAAIHAASAIHTGVEPVHRSTTAIPAIHTIHVRKGPA
jgi:hypothetical protein